MRKMLMALLATAALGASTVAIAPAASAAATNKITITATDYAYGIKGTLKPGRATIVFKNEGKEPHVMALLHLKKGKTAKDFNKAVKKGNESAFGALSARDESMGAPFILTPGQETEVVTETVKAGVWGMLCFIQDASGKPHLAEGMTATFNVKGKGVKVAPPEAQAEVTLTDTGITVPPSDAPSNVTLKITNEGTSDHSFAVVKLNGSSAIGDVNAYFNSTYKGGPWPADAPGEIVGGIGDLKPQGVAYLTWKNLPAGHYGYLSITGDSPDDDFSKGLQGEFNIS
jgi:hypothetical protein